MEPNLAMVVQMSCLKMVYMFVAEADDMMDEAHGTFGEPLTGRESRAECCQRAVTQRGTVKTQPPITLFQ